MRIRANIKRNSFRDFSYGLSAANKVIPIVAENNEKTNIISIKLLRYIMLVNYYYCDCTILSAERRIVGIMAILVAFIDRDDAYRKSKTNESLCISRIRKARIFWTWDESEMCALMRSPQSHKRHLLRLISHKIHIHIHTYTHRYCDSWGRRGGSTSGLRRGSFFFEH